MVSNIKETMIEEIKKLCKIYFGLNDNRDLNWSENDNNKA